PVHLADVVVGQIVADRFELGSQPQRAPAPPRGVAELPEPYLGGEATGGRHVGVHDEGGGGTGAVIPAPEAQRTLGEGGWGRNRVGAAPESGDVRDQRLLALLGVDANVGTSD